METQTRKVPIPPDVFKALERKAKAEGRTPDECALSLLFRAMINDYIPADCPHCEKEIWIPKTGPPITREAYQQLNRDTLLEMKRERKQAQAEAAKRVAIPMDVSLLAEAKKQNVNIEEATREHFKDVKQLFPKKA